MCPSATCPPDRDRVGNDGDHAEEPLPTWGRVILWATAVGIATLVLAYLITAVLVVTPSPWTSPQVQAAAGRALAPEFDQWWRMFAPNPEQVNRRVSARVRTTGQRVRDAAPSDWYDLTEAELAGIRHTLAPSQVNQNMLRIAWLFYATTHTEDSEQPAAPEADLALLNLKRTVLQRLAATTRTDQVIAVQLRVVSAPVPTPSWSDTTMGLEPSIRLLPWWPVTAHDREGL